MSLDCELKKALIEIDRLIYKIKQPKCYLNSFFSRILQCFEKKFKLNSHDKSMIESWRYDCLNSAETLNMSCELELLLVLKRKFNTWLASSDLQMNNENLINQKFNEKLIKLDKLKEFITQLLFVNKFNQIEKQISKLKKKYVNEKNQGCISRNDRVTENDTVIHQDNTSKGDEEAEDDDIIYLETTVSKTPLQLPTKQTIILYNQAKRLAARFPHEFSSDNDLC